MAHNAYKKAAEHHAAAETMPTVTMKAAMSMQGRPMSTPRMRIIIPPVRTSVGLACLAGFGCQALDR
jgi:hypothetical protein